MAGSAPVDREVELSQTWRSDHGGHRSRYPSAMGVWRVFLSHTSELAKFPTSRSYVTAAQAAVTRAGEAVMDMAYFTARDQRPADYCREVVATADVYVAVVGFRYGSLVPDVDQTSYTQFEFETATDRGIPRLVFVLDEDSDRLGLPARALADLESGALQNDFRTRLRQPSIGLTLCSVDGVEQFETALYQALVELRQAQAPSRGRDDRRAKVAGTSAQIPPGVLQSYFTRLGQQYRRLDLEALTPAQRDEQLPILLRNVFIAQDVREKPPPVELSKELWKRLEAGGEIRRKDLPEGLDAEMLAAARKAYSATTRRPVMEILTGGSRLTVLLGDPGAGKSSLARYLVLNITEGAVAGGSVETLPILVELRSFAQQSPHHDTFVDYIDHQARTDKLGIPAEHLEPYLRSGGKALVIFDGLDEIFDPRDRDAVARQIAGFAVEYPDARIVVTSRIIGYRRGPLSDAGFLHYTIQDLDRGQIHDFLGKWYGIVFGGRDHEADQRRQRLVAAIENSRPIEELAGNPLLLTILAIIGKHQELPRERWEVYDHAASVLVEHWDVNRYLQDRRVDAEFIGKEDKRELLRRIADRMQSSRPGLVGNFIHHSELVEEFETYLRDRYQRDPADAKVVAEAMINQFRERNFILSRYGAEVYGFVHRAFLEFFCADHIRRQFERTQELSLEQLRKDVYGRHWDDDSWREVLLLIAGMLDERFTTSIIEYLLFDTNFPWPPSFGETPLRNVLLAALCLAEIRNRRSAAPVARQLLSQLIDLLERSADGESSADDFLDQDLLPAVGLVGPDWPGREMFLAWFRVIGSTVTRVPTARLATRVLAYLFFDRTDVTAILCARATFMEHWALREAAVIALIQGRRDDPDSLDVLRNRAENDLVATVRWRSLEGVVQRFPDDPTVLQWLRERAEKDPAALVRQTAVEKLTQGPSGLSDIESWLRVRAEADPDSSVRAAAADELAKRVPASPETAAWLEGRLLAGASWEIRRAAIKSLWDTDKHQDDVLARLRQIGLADLHWEVRRAAVEKVATMWRDHPDTRSWVCGRAELDHQPDVRRAAVEAVEAGWRDDPATPSWLHGRLLHDRAAKVRLAAARALLKTLQTGDEQADLLRVRAAEDPDWGIRDVLVKGIAEGSPHDPATLSWLRQRATDDPLGNVRKAALVAVARGWPQDPATLSWLRQRATNDPAGNVREAALLAVARGWHDDPEILPWLQDRASGDHYWAVRRAAVCALALVGRRHGHPSVLPWLRQCATDDPDEDVREAALVTVARGWPQEPDTLPWLRQRGTNDPDHDVRKAALAAVARGWRDHPETFPWLRDRALHDPHWSVQEAAILMVAEGWHDHPDALSWALQCATLEKEWSLCRPAVGVVGRAWHDSPDSLPWLCEMATAHMWSTAREHALKTVVLHSGDRRRIDVWLGERAISERYYSPRYFATWALVQGWAHSQETVQTIRRIAVCDSVAYIRRQAVCMLSFLPAVTGQAHFLQKVSVSDDSAGVRAEAVTRSTEARPATPQLRTWLWRRLDDRSSLVRRAVIRAIARGWGKDPATLRRLLDHAENDPRRDVRQEAFLVLETMRSDDPDSLCSAVQRHLRRRTRKAPAQTAELQEIAALPWADLERTFAVHPWQVRRRVVEIVAAARAADLHTLPWLLGLAAREGDWAIRVAVVHAVGDGWHEDPGTLRWLRERTVEDRSNYVRRAALRAIARWRIDDSEIRSWILDLAVADHHPVVRKVAVQIAATQFREWPDIIPWLRERATSDYGELVSYAAVRGVIELAPEDPAARAWLREIVDADVELNVQGLAVRLVGHGHARADPDTRAWLRRQAVDTNIWQVRCQAVRVLGQEYAASSEVGIFLRERACTDVYPEVRRAAIQAVARGWRDHPDTLPWLRERASTDVYSNVRQAAVQAVAHGWRDHSDTLPWLRERASTDVYSNVRQEAIRAVARGWRDHPDTLEWLRSQTLLGVWDSVREAAAEVIAQYWPEHPDTLPLLKNLGVYDASSSVRGAMAWAVARGWPDHPDTLPWLCRMAYRGRDSTVRNAGRRALAWVVSGRSDAAYWLTYGLDHHQEELLHASA